jgi:hypothetical protein
MNDVMNAVLRRSDVERLALERDGLVVSFFQPMRRDAYERSENSGLLKTLFYSARRMLGEHGLSAGEVERFLWPIRTIIEDSSFWGRRAEGLALFVRSEGFEVYRLNHTVPKRVDVGRSAVITPLLPALAVPERFYVLGVSRNRVRFWRCEGDDVRDVELKAFGIPHDLSETLRFDEFSRELQSHSTSTSVPNLTSHHGSQRTGKHVWHGHGGGGEEDKEHLTRFLHAVETGVRRAIVRTPGPLILAGVGYEIDLYRTLASGEAVLAETILGNPDRLTDADVLAEGTRIALRAPDAPTRSAVSSYEKARGQGRTLTDIAKVVRAAFEGGVDVLLLAGSDPVWGVFDPATGGLYLTEGKRPASVDLHDLAARETIGHGGDAFVLSADEMPEGSSTVAILRY